MNDLSLLSAHVAALFTQDSRGRLIAGNEPGGKPAPRFFLGRTSEGSGCWFGAGMPEDLVVALTAESLRLPPRMPRQEESDSVGAPILALLAETSPIQRIWSGPAFRFPDRLDIGPGVVAIDAANASVLSAHLDPWREDVARGEVLHGVLVDGAAVAVCGSVRRTPIACEAGVETAAPFRRKGYASLAVTGWAAAMRGEGKIPLYSTSWSNAASCALARRLGLIQFAADLHVT